MAPVALISRCCDFRPVHQRLRHPPDGFRLNARHVGQRDNPATGITRCVDPVGQTDTHALRCIGADRDHAAFLLQHFSHRKIARPHHCRDFEPCLDQMARRVRGNRRAVFQRMQQLAAAKTSTCTSRQQDC